MQEWISRNTREGSRVLCGFSLHLFGFSGADSLHLIVFSGVRDLWFKAVPCGQADG
jgi:hypothetical protein